MITAIVYTSNAGSTKQYARLLAEELNLPCLPLRQAKKELPKNTEIIYLGWIMANRVNKLKNASKRFNIRAVCAVGMMGTGTNINEIRTASKLSESMPLFSLQGAFDIKKLKGIYKFLMKLVIKALIKDINEKPDPTPADLAMVETFKHGGSYVSADNLGAVTQWYNNIQ